MQSAYDPVTFFSPTRASANTHELHAISIGVVLCLRTHKIVVTLLLTPCFLYVL